MAKRKGPSTEGGKGPSSCFILSEDNFLRRNVKAFTEWSVFEYAVLLTIIANCVVLALEEHLPEKDRTPLALQLVRLPFSTFLLLCILFFSHTPFQPFKSILLLISSFFQPLSNRATHRAPG